MGNKQQKEQQKDNKKIEYTFFSVDKSPSNTSQRDEIIYVVKKISL